MPYSQKNNPVKMMKSALKMHKAEKKAGMHRDSAMYMNHSLMEMGHSPMERESRELKDMPIVDIEKGDAKGDMKKGSPAKADKPISEHFDGNKEMQAVHSKQTHHSRSSASNPGHSKEEVKKILKSDERKGSPAKAAKPDYPDIDKDGDTSESMKKAAADKKKGSPAKMGHKKSPAKMGHKDSPAKKYDRVVLGGNKGDKSKTKPGKKDYEK